MYIENAFKCIIVLHRVFDSYYYHVHEVIRIRRLEPISVEKSIIWFRNGVIGRLRSTVFRESVELYGISLLIWSNHNFVAISLIMDKPVEFEFEFSNKPTIITGVIDYGSSSLTFAQNKVLLRDFSSFT